MSASATMMAPQKEALKKNESEKRYADARWQPMMALPCSLAVELSLPGFKVSDFIALKAGAVVSTGWNITKDVPLRANGALIGWGELEGSANHLAIRLTELA